MPGSVLDTGAIDLHDHRILSADGERGHGGCENLGAEDPNSLRVRDFSQTWALRPIGQETNCSTWAAEEQGGWPGP